MTSAPLTAALLLLTLSGAGAFALRATPEEPSPAPAERELRRQDGLWRQMEKELRVRGFDCPRIKAIYLISQEDVRSNIRVLCGGLAAPELSQVRITSRGSGSYQAEPWTVEGSEPDAPSLASRLALKASLE